MSAVPYRSKKSAAAATYVQRAAPVTEDVVMKEEEPQIDQTVVEPFEPLNLDLDALEAEEKKLHGETEELKKRRAEIRKQKAEILRLKNQAPVRAPQLYLLDKEIFSIIYGPQAAVEYATKAEILEAFHTWVVLNKKLGSGNRYGIEHTPLIDLFVDEHGQPWRLPLSKNSTVLGFNKTNMWNYLLQGNFVTTKQAEEARQQAEAAVAAAPKAAATTTKKAKKVKKEKVTPMEA